VTNILDRNMTVAEKLLKDMEKVTKDEKGISREPFGHGEYIAHELFKKLAIKFDLEGSTDIAHNTYVRLPGSDRNTPTLITGSHLDSQPLGLS
jgi:acetylornithine deacetylase/succinyl-diaminopimelate desuccinylase-like protein